MKIEIELNLPELIASAVSAERIQPILDKAISDAITSAIRDATGYNSPFSKALKQQLTDAMPHGLSIDDVAKFGHVLNAAITDAVHGANTATIQAALRQAATAALPDVPSRINLSELLKDARESFRKEEHEAFYAHLELSDYGGGWIYLDDDGDTKEKDRADIRLAFSKEGEVYALRLDGQHVTPKSLPQVIGSFEGILMSMYVGRTSLEVDLDADEVEYAAAEKFD
jgi:phage tail protein X